MKEIPLFEILWDEDDIEAITSVIKSGKRWAIGQYNTEFEQKLAEYLDTTYCILFNSGTSALHALLIAYGFEKGSEIIVPSFTFISTVNSVLFVGSKPVLAEIEEETLGLDPDDVMNKITSKTKAILPIHYAGSPCKIKALKDIAEDHDLILIEDAAESLGAKINEKKVGSYGDSAMLSFCQNKIITTGEGGAIVTNSAELNESLRLIRSHGRSEKEDYFKSSSGFDYVRLGYNFRLSNILAALGLSQLSKIDEIISKRREVAKYYINELESIEKIHPFQPPKDYFHVYQLFTIFVEKYLRNDLIKYLSQNKIGNKIYFSPVHLTEFYKNSFGFKKGDFPVTEKISDTVLSLPMSPILKEEEVKYIVTKIKDFMEKN
jgi:dTDP-4-amino-4,6-dideoxygalactose transaminase